MKTLKKILLIVTLTFLLTGCTKGSMVEINYKDLTKMLNNKQSFILFIGSNECSNCSNYKVTVNNIIKHYKLTYYYIDIANLSDSDVNKLQGQFYFSGVPTTVFIEKGTEKNTNKRIVGAVEYSTAIKALQKAGYIK